MGWIGAHRRMVTALAGVVIVGLGLGLGLGLTGGNGSSPRGGSSNSSSSVPNTGSTPNGSVPVTGPTTPTDTEPSNPSSTVAGIALCRLAGLTVSLGAVKQVAGHEGAPIVFTSTSPTQCQLAAYPTVIAYTASGAKAGQALAQPGGFVTGNGPNGVAGHVILTNGTSASAGVEVGMSGQNCVSIVRLTVGVPGDPSTMSLAVNWDDCYAFLVHPFDPGTTGSA